MMIMDNDRLCGTGGEMGQREGMGSAMTPTAPDQGSLIARCLEQQVWAVVGASTDPAKWGYRVYAALKGARLSRLSD